MRTRLFIYATGSVSCWNLPFWLLYLHSEQPDIEIHVGLSPSAATFVSPRTIEAISGRPPFIDSWDSTGFGHSPHTEIAGSHDAFVVHPATMNFLARLATGSADTPVLAALQITSAVIAIAPALPPGARRSAAVRRNLATLAEDERIRIAPMIASASMSTGEETDTGPAPLAEVVATALSCAVGTATANRYST